MGGSYSTNEADGKRIQYFNRKTLKEDATWHNFEIDYGNSKFGKEGLLDSLASLWGAMADCNKRSSSVNGREILDHLRDHQLLKKDSSPWG
jgi:hypothetical protein